MIGDYKAQTWVDYWEAVKEAVTVGGLYVIAYGPWFITDDRALASDVGHILVYVGSRS